LTAKVNLHTLAIIINNRCALLLNSESRKANKRVGTLKKEKMKKLNVKGKLSLGKETIAKLNGEQMNNIVGGTTGRTCSVSGTCWDGITNICESTCFAFQGTLSCCT